MWTCTICVYDAIHTACHMELHGACARYLQSCAVSAAVAAERITSRFLFFQFESKSIVFIARRIQLISK